MTHYPALRPLAFRNRTVYNGACRRPTPVSPPRARAFPLPSPLGDLCTTPLVLEGAGRSCSLSLWERVGVRVFRATHPGLRKGLLWAPRLWRRPWAGFLRASLAVLRRLRPFRPEPGPLPPAAPGPSARRGLAPAPRVPSTASLHPKKSPKTLPRQRDPLWGSRWRGRVPPFIPHAHLGTPRPFRPPENPSCFRHPVNWPRRAPAAPHPRLRRYHDPRRDSLNPRPHA